MCENTHRKNNILTICKTLYFAMKMSFHSAIKVAPLLLLLAAQCKSISEGNRNVSMNNIPRCACTAANLSIDCTSSWQYCDNGTCLCGQKAPFQALHCQPGKNLTVTSCYCVTAQANLLTELGKCLYNCGDLGKSHPADNIHTTLPKTPSEIDTLMCGHYNRTGTLCGKCYDEFYPLVHSFDMYCIKCPNGKANWWKFLLVAFLPVTVFYFVVLFFSINITSSHLQGFVFCSQAISMPAMARILLMNTVRKSHFESVVRYIGSLYGVWNLDFLQFLKLELCLETDMLQTLALEMAVGIYPLLLMVLTFLLIRLYDSNFQPLVIVWKPINKLLGLFRKEWQVKTSLIDAFATFFVLTYMKFLTVSFDLLAPVTVYQLNSTGHLTHQTRLYYDATILYFGKRHLPYAILALSVLTLFVLVPTLLLMLYPMRCFQKLLNLFRFRWYVLHTFVDTFQGCYKDGTEPGTRDCRWFSYIHLLLLLLAMTIHAQTANLMSFPFLSILVVLGALLFITVQPFKSSTHDHSNTTATFMLLLAVFFVSLTGYQIAQIQNPRLSLPFLTVAALVNIAIIFYISFIILKWTYIQMRLGIRLLKRLHAWRHGYKPLD